MGVIKQVKRSYIARKPGKPMKRSRMSPKPKQGRKAAIAQADDAIKALTLAQNPTCQYPGCHEDAVDNHHIVKRRNYALRWRRANNVALCRMHHSWDDVSSKCVEFDEAMVEIVGGPEAMEALRLEGNTGTSECPEDAIRRLKGE